LNRQFGEYSQNDLSFFWVLVEVLQSHWGGWFLLKSGLDFVAGGGSFAPDLSSLPF
jgi:hypothetical protein